MQPNSRRTGVGTTDRTGNDDRFSPPPRIIPSPPPPIPPLPSSISRRSIPAVLVSPTSPPRPPSPRPMSVVSRNQSSEPSTSPPAAAPEPRRRLSPPRSRFMLYGMNSDRVTASRVQPQSAIQSGPGSSREDEIEDPLPDSQFPSGTRAVAPAIPPRRDPPPSHVVDQLETLEDLAAARAGGPWIVVYAYRCGQHRYRAADNNNILEALASRHRPLLRMYELEITENTEVAEAIEATDLPESFNLVHLDYCNVTRIRHGPIAEVEETLVEWEERVRSAPASGWPLSNGVQAEARGENEEQRQSSS